MWSTVVNRQVKILLLNSKRWAVLMAIKSIKIWHNKQSLIINRITVVPENGVPLAGKYKGDLFCVWNITKYWQHNFFLLHITYLGNYGTKYYTDRKDIIWEKENSDSLQVYYSSQRKKIRVHQSMNSLESDLALLVT